MKRIYKGNTKLRLLVDTACDLSGYVSVCICCTKPDGSFVAFNAVVKDVENGIVFYDVQNENDFNQTGWWKIWPEIVFDDDRNNCGRAMRVFVYEPGSV